MTRDVLVKAESVSKKFCRSLKRSMWYGIRDVTGEFLGRKGGQGQLRKNEFWAVNDVSFELKRGDCLGLIGSNGAGKSTLLKMLNGLVKPDRGRITVCGRVGALIELGAGFNPILTARENIYVNGSVLGFSRKEIDRKFDAIVDFAEMDEFIDMPVQSFSSGMRVRLGFAVAAQMEPDVLLIDEVLAVGDAAFRAKCLSKLGSLFDSTAMILVSHSMPMISRMSSVALLLERGRTALFSKDIGAAVRRYQATLPVPSQTNSGTGPVRLESLILHSGGNQIRSPEHVVSYGQDLTLEFSWSSQALLPELAVNLSIFDLESSCVAQCFSINSDNLFHPQSRSFSVSVTIDEILLNPGRYSIQVAMVESKTRSRRGEILYFDRCACSIHVVGESIGFAPVQLRGRWHLVG